MSEAQLSLDKKRDSTADCQAVRGLLSALNGEHTLLPEHVMWQRVIRGASEFKVYSGSLCNLFELETM